MYHKSCCHYPWHNPPHCQRGSNWNHCWDIYHNWCDHKRTYTRTSRGGKVDLRDYGPQPFVVNIDRATKQNDTFRTALWTGENFQVTLMSIQVGDDIGLEVHPRTDQFIRVEEGQGLVRMGNSKHNLNFEHRVYDGDAVMIPAGKWHNVINTGNKPLKVYVIYAPPEHPFGTVHQTKAIAESAAGTGQ